MVKKYGQILGVTTLLFFMATLVVFLYEYLNYKTYCIHLDNHQLLSGLSSNLPVEFNGVLVGKVQRIEFAADDPKKLKVLLKLSSKTPVSKDTRAKINSSPFVVLNDEGHNKEPPTINDGEKYPFILTANEETNSRDVNLEKIAASLDKFNELVASLLTKENTENLSQIMYSLQQVTSVFSAQSERLNNIIVNSDEMLQEGPQLIRTANKQTLPRVYQLLNSTEDLLLTMQQVAKMLKQNPTVLVRGKPKPTLGPGEKLTRSGVNK